MGGPLPWHLVQADITESFRTFLSSPLTWAILGTVATVATGVVTIWHQRSRKRQPTPPPLAAINPTTAPVVGAAVEELDSERAWVQAQVSAIRSAKHVASLCIHTINSSDDVWKANLVNAALADAASRGLELRVLAASNPRHLGGAFELDNGLGIDVRFAPQLRHYDLRFLLADSDLVVFGVALPDLEHGGYRPSYSWAVLRSASLTEALERDFQRMWLSPHSLSFTRLCIEILRPTGASPPARLAADLGLDYEVMRRLASLQPIASVTGNAVLVLFGKCCSGKSSLLRGLARENGATCLDYRDIVLPYIHRYGVTHIDDQVAQQVNADLLRFMRQGNYDAIETRPECGGALLQELFEAIASKATRPILVHCDLPTAIALKRNARRPAPIPVETVLAQAALEETGVYRKVCEVARVPIVTIAADAPVADCRQQLLAALQQGFSAC